MTKKLEKLIEAHRAEAKRRNAEIVNLGWVLDKDGILSKTTEGKLESYFANKNCIAHIWH